MVGVSSMYLNTSYVKVPGLFIMRSKEDKKNLNTSYVKVPERKKIWTKF